MTPDEIFELLSSYWMSKSYTSQELSADPSLKEMKRGTVPKRDNHILYSLFEQAGNVIGPAKFPVGTKFTVLNDRGDRYLMTVVKYVLRDGVPVTSMNQQYLHYDGEHLVPINNRVVDLVWKKITLSHK